MQNECVSVAQVKCVRVLFLFCAPPSRSSIHSSVHPSIRPYRPVQSPSHAQQPEEEEDGHKQEEGVLPVVIAVVEVTGALVITCILVWQGGGGGWMGTFVTPASQGIVCLHLYTNDVAWRQQLFPNGAFYPLMIWTIPSQGFCINTTKNAFLIFSLVRINFQQQLKPELW